MARQFDVFVSPPPIKKIYPYIIVLQHDSVTSAVEVIVAPLVPPSCTTPSGINPLLEVADRPFVLQTPNLATVPRSGLKKPIANLQPSRDRIIAAIDMVFAGS